MRLTDMRVQALKPDPTKHKIYYDETIKGFGVRVTKGGTKAFVLSVGKNRDRTTIGQYPSVTLAKAREVAKTMLAERQLGRYQTRKTNLGDALDLYATHHIGKLAPRTQHELNRLFKRYLTALRSRELTTLTAKDITDITDKSAPSEAEHFHRAVKTFFRWCVGRSLIDRSPIEATKAPAKWTPRDRVLADEELVKVWNVADPETRFGCIIRLCILLGQRRSEIASIQPEWFKDGMLTFPASLTKNRRAHVVPCTDQAASYIKRSPFAFNSWSKSKAALDKLAQIDPWTLHDLRRTFASGMQRLGVRIEVTEKVLNHVSGSISGIVGVYQKYDYQTEMREAVERWETHLSGLLRQHEAPKHLSVLDKTA